MVAMEAAASGTPVIAFRRGALPEVVRDHQTGLLVETVEEAVAACRQIDSIDPEACTNYAQENFSSARMAEDYTRLYTRVFSAHSATAAR
jgi:glycosyltransferase involved in cell wall biosynthesis